MTTERKCDASLRDAELELMYCAQGLLTALNVGEVQSGSPIHMNLRDVVTQYRAAKEREVKHAPEAVDDEELYICPTIGGGDMFTIEEWEQEFRKLGVSVSDPVELFLIGEPIWYRLVTETTSRLVRVEDGEGE